MEKDRELYRQRQRQQYRQAEGDTPSPEVCICCHARIPAGARFCETCGQPVGGHTCHSCGAIVEPGMSICPACGHPATAQCTFCGAEMSAGEAFCQECGNPRGGILCPECGTLNFRSFCRKCNHPLNPMALQALKQAKADPRYQRACKLAEEIADMEDEMARLEQLIAREQAAAAEPTLAVDDSVSEETQRLLDEFERLSQMAPGRKRPVERPKPTSTAPKKAEAFVIDADVDRQDIESPGGSGGFSDTAARLEQLRKQYHAKAAQLQREIDEMIPDPADPPEIQRNYACAHKISIRYVEYSKERQRIAWVCNKCNIQHSDPSQCGVREFGGKWIFREVTVAREVTGSSTINI